MQTNDPFAANIQSDVMLPEIKMEPAVVRDAPAREAAKAAITERRVKIMLEDGEHIPPTGQFFGLNGKGYMLKSNMEALVPEGIIGILNSAVIDSPIIDPDTKQVTGWRKRLRFPYRIIGVVEPERTAA